jgi:hypothetical protein
MRLSLVLLCVAIMAVVASIARAEDAPSPALFRVLDLDRGESQEVQFASGGKATVKLLGVEETRDALRSAIRLARLKLEVNGTQTTIASGNYRLPVTVAGVQVDCPVTKGYYRNCDP